MGEHYNSVLRLRRLWCFEAASWAVNDETKRSWKMYVGVHCKCCRNCLCVDVRKL
jgi:hypothetical protein